MFTPRQKIINQYKYASNRKRLLKRKGGIWFFVSMVDRKRNHGFKSQTRLRGVIRNCFLIGNTTKSCN